MTKENKDRSLFSYFICTVFLNMRLIIKLTRLYRVHSPIQAYTRIHSMSYYICTVFLNMGLIIKLTRLYRVFQCFVILPVLLLQLQWYNVKRTKFYSIPFSPDHKVHLITYALTKSRNPHLQKTYNSAPLERLELSTRLGSGIRMISYSTFGTFWMKIWMVHILEWSAYVEPEFMFLGKFWSFGTPYFADILV